MRPALILAATLFGTSATAAVEGAASGAALDPIERAIQNYAQVNTYTVIIRSVKQNKEEELHAKQWIQVVGVLNEFKSGKNWLLFIGLTLLSGLILFGPSFLLGK